MFEYTEEMTSQVTPTIEKIRQEFELMPCKSFPVMCVFALALTKLKPELNAWKELTFWLTHRP